MTNKEEPSVLLRIFEGEDEDLDFFKDSFSYQVGLGPFRICYVIEFY